MGDGGLGPEHLRTTSLHLYIFLMLLAADRQRERCRSRVLLQVWGHFTHLDLRQAVSDDIAHVALPLDVDLGGFPEPHSCSSATTTTRGRS